MKQISLGESHGKQRFSGDIIRTENWSKEDWHAYVLYKIVHANTRNAEGIFFGNNEPDQTHRYKIAHCALLNYIRYSNTSPKEPITPDSMAGDRFDDGTDKGMEDLPNIEGLTVIWKNCNDQVNGYPLDNEDTEDMYHRRFGIGIDVRQYHSGLGSRERQYLVKTFHEEQYEAMVLIGSYSVNSCGLNLHGHCRNVLIFEPGPSTPIEFQAIGRVYRVGQEQTVRVIRLFLQQSWNEWEEGNGLVKELPALMAELTMNIFGANEDPDAEDTVSLGDRDISIKRYVLFDNRLVPAEERPGIEALTTEELLKHISRMIKDQRNFRSKARKQI
ncbi:MAG: hypothetical protein M1839_007309 [Geoglossum umbratile]|nr:MAG: hypothetical protein M1839_007309 [Geoglossum umbratile]